MEQSAVDTVARPAAHDSNLASHPSWLMIKTAAEALHPLQSKDGSVENADDHASARRHVTDIIEGVRNLAPYFPWDETYLDAVQADFTRWVDGGFGVPDFYDALVAFRPEQNRVDGLKHLVVFPMHTQNGSRNRHVEAVLVEVLWPDFIAELEAADFSNKLFVPIRFIDFTSGYDTNAAVLFPETVAIRELPAFTWGAIFQDREAARFRRVVAAASEITKLDLPDDARELLENQTLAEETFVMWDLIHDRTHMRGDLPFDPFMIKQRSPYFMYSLEEMRCDMTAFRESVRLERELTARAQGDGEPLTHAESEVLRHAKLVQYAVIFDRIFRFALTGSRSRNYDGLGGQLLFAWLHQRDVLHWTDTKLTIDWAEVPDVVVALGDAINDLYWRSIDRPKKSHWLAAYDLVRSVVEPHPASAWARGLDDETLSGPPRGMTDAVLDDEFPLSMFYEALNKKMGDVIESTAGITGRD
ncbi:DUF6421 family protein [Paramicrobacterium agarici]|uniref:DUF6421 family protein n=1 Tax=Paramicrobacterium agarici TaxID=630514 RepID=UPI00114D5D25|nr:DUF6421 family protein [Microbacterium agarici]TQO23324.1 hypothetical protein FB385_2174 [Microbacterium agarici]